MAQCAPPRPFVQGGSEDTAGRQSPAQTRPRSCVACGLWTAGGCSGWWVGLSNGTWTRARPDKSSAQCAPRSGHHIWGNLGRWGRKALCSTCKANKLDACPKPPSEPPTHGQRKSHLANLWDAVGQCLGTKDMLWVNIFDHLPKRARRDTEVNGKIVQLQQKNATRPCGMEGTGALQELLKYFGRCKRRL